MSHEQLLDKLEFLCIMCFSFYLDMLYCLPSPCTVFWSWWFLLFFSCPYYSLVCPRPFLFGERPECCQALLACYQDFAAWLSRLWWLCLNLQAARAWDIDKASKTHDENDTTAFVLRISLNDPRLCTANNTSCFSHSFLARIWTHGAWQASWTTLCLLCALC